MTVQNIELVRGEENTIHWLIPEPNMVEIRLQLVTDEAIVILTQERFVEEGGGTGVYAIFNLGEIEDLDAQNGGASNYILKDTQYDEILFTGTVTLTGVGGGTPAEVVFEDLVLMKTDADIADVAITAAIDRVITTTDNKEYKKNIGETAWEEVGKAISKRYVATMVQGDGTAPVASVIHHNDIGNIVWSYVSAGSYLGTLVGAFPAGKVKYIRQVIIESGTPAEMWVSGDRASDDTITLTSTLDWNETIVLEIEVFN